MDRRCVTSSSARRGRGLTPISPSCPGLQRSTGSTSWFSVPRIGEKAIAEFQKTSPWIRVARTAEASLGILAESQEGTAAAKIDEVLPGSPAERGGLQKRDQILELNGKPVHDFGELSKSVRTLKHGQKAAIKLLRDGKEKNVTVEFGDWK